jgi:hypothetical protein
VRTEVNLPGWLDQNASTFPPATVSSFRGGARSCATVSLSDRPDSRTWVEKRTYLWPLLNWELNRGIPIAHLVGWFSCTAWNDPGDRRREDTPSMSLRQIQDLLDAAALRVSIEPIKVRALVINTSLR